ncbi:MAG: hypothetical protein ACREJC_06530 [Tepidisphaeraceae bacterium]
MMPRLIEILSFVNVADGATVPLPHHINVAGTQYTPDLVMVDNSGFAVTVNATTCSVTNNSGDINSVNVWLELKHGIPRELGPVTVPGQGMTPRPFYPIAGGGGGASATKVWDYPAVGQAVLPGVPFLTVNGFQTVLGKRYTYIASASFVGNATGADADMGLVVIQDSGKGAIQLVESLSYPAPQTDGDVAVTLVGQGTFIGDGALHDYTMYAAWNEDVAWTVRGFGGMVWLTIIEADNQQ